MGERGGEICLAFRGGSFWSFLVVFGVVWWMRECVLGLCGGCAGGLLLLLGCLGGGGIGGLFLLMKPLLLYFSFVVIFVCVGCGGGIGEVLLLLVLCR